MIDVLSWVIALPEIFLLVMACVVLLVDLFVRSPLRTPTYVLTVLTLLVVAYLELSFAVRGSRQYGFGGMIVSDAMGSWLKFFATLAFLATVVYGRNYSAQLGMLRRGGEWFTLGLFGLLGMFVMISGNHFLIVYMGLELLTLPTYALVALRRDHMASTEAAMKYFVLGSLASGFLLYGLSMLYGATGTLFLTDVQQALLQGAFEKQVMVFALVFLVAGLAFKLGAVPFHMWIPDVYQGAPTSVTLMIGAAPKLAAFALAIRLLVNGMWPLADQWQQMMVVLAVGSLLVGNFAAIMQTNVKRMLAYSTIAQVGFLLLAFVAGFVDRNVHSVIDAYSAGMFYIVSYVLTTLVNFGVLMVLSRDGFDCENLRDLAGLNQRSPLYAAVMAISLLSLAGLPPLIGFYAKLTVLQSLIATGQPFYIGLAVFAVVMSLIGAFYYLRVIKVMYFDAPSPQLPRQLQAGWDVRAVLSFNGALILLLGILPAGLMAVCSFAIERMLVG